MSANTRPPTGRARRGPGATKTATAANTLKQATACCATAERHYRDGDALAALDQARLAMRFLAEVVGATP